MDALLKKFNDSRQNDEEAQERIHIDQQMNGVNPFDLPANSRSYDKQYFEMYQHRLKILKERVKRSCEKKWDDNFKLNGKRVVMKPKVLDIKGNQPCWVIGAIYCEMKYKPNILEEVINDVHGAPDLTKSYTDPDGSDEIMLEDESGRVLLVGEFIRSTPFVTGTIVGLLGMEADAGTFQVLDICYPMPISQKPLSIKSGIECESSSSKKKVALISGLNISTTSPNLLLKLQLLQEFLMGRISKQREIVNIGKLIICGDCLSSESVQDGPGKMINCLEELGKFLGNILQTIPVMLMPGSNDPSDKSLPQQPFHKALFKHSLEGYFSGNNDRILALSTNPCKFNVEGVEILAISGQNIDDICKYVIPYQCEDDHITGSDTAEHRMDLMECTMRWQNIAPTAPDTLCSYPYKDLDPFILEEFPHVYIVGNQPDYGVRDLAIEDVKIKIISLPKFSTSGELVLLDLETLQPEVIKFDV